MDDNLTNASTIDNQTGNDYQTTTSTVSNPIDLSSTTSEEPAPSTDATSYSSNNSSADTESSVISGLGTPPPLDDTTSPSLIGDDSSNSNDAPIASADTSISTSNEDLASIKAQALTQLAPILKDLDQSDYLLY